MEIIITIIILGIAILVGRVIWRKMELKKIQEEKKKIKLARLKVLLLSNPPAR